MSPIEPVAPRAGGRRELVSALLVALSTGAFGILLGFVWYLLAPPLPGKKVQGGLAYISPYPEEQVAQDGWFAILGLVFGVLAAVFAWFWVRRWRGPIQLFAVTFGAIAAGFVAATVGGQIGLDDYRERVAAAPIGTVVSKPIELSVASTRTCVWGGCVVVPGGGLFVPGLGAAVGYALLAGWSRWPGLRGEEDEDVPFEQPVAVSSGPAVGPAEPGSPEPRAPM